MHNWYVIHVYSGMEKVVYKDILKRIEKSGLQSFFGQILVPSEEILEIKNGKKSIIERKIFPGYIIIEMEMNNKCLYLIKNTNRVNGFLGNSGKNNQPTPISKFELEYLLKRSEKGIYKPRPKVFFEVGEIINVKKGPFSDFSGNIEEVIYEKSKLRVSVTIFGRSTPVELYFNQVEKI